MPQLVANGHDVTGMTRSESKRDLVRSLGARPVVADALDPDAVAQAVAEAEPEVIVHELTALSGSFDTAALRALLRGDEPAAHRGHRPPARRRPRGGSAAVRGAELRGLAAFARIDGMVKSETDPLDPDPPDAIRPTIDAIRHLEDGGDRRSTGARASCSATAASTAPAPRLSRDPDADMSGQIRKRRFPVVGSGDGLWSFIHIEDAATATVAAIEHGRRGIYQVTDDEPAPAREWLPVLASALHAKPPRHFPRWLARLIAGEAATVMMTEGRGASNAKAKRELGWQPRYASWRQGFAEGLG